MQSWAEFHELIDIVPACSCLGKGTSRTRFSMLRRARVTFFADSLNCQSAQVSARRFLACQGAEIMAVSWGDHVWRDSCWSGGTGVRKCQNAPWYCWAADGLFPPL